MDFPHSLAVHTKLFRALLYCYPAEFRHEYGAEMEQLFSERLRSEPRSRLWLETCADVALTAPKEHCAILASDLKHEIRALRAMPGFAAIVLFVMALGIGATVSIFSVVNAVLLRSLPYGHPQKLVYLFSPNVNFKGVPDELGPNVPDFYDWQRLSHSFSSMATFRQGKTNFFRNGSAKQTATAWVTASFFRTLDVKASLGRTLDSNDDQTGHEAVAVISHQLWLSQPDILGARIQLNHKSFTVVGVMPKDFGYPFDGDVPYDRSGFKQIDIWLPAAYTASQISDRVSFASANAIGRLRDGVTASAAQSELQAIEAHLQSRYAPMWQGWSVLVRPFAQTILGPVQQMFSLLLGVVGLVLVIAVSNVAGLMLARTTSRAHELGIRTALGAERARIIRQLLTESLLLSCTGGAMGIALAYALVRLLITLNPGGIPRFSSATVDAQALSFAIALSIAAGLTAGIAPAISASAPSISELLKRAGTRVVRGSHRGRFALIILEVALSVVLLTGSGLLIRSYLQLQAVDAGFSPSTLTFWLELDANYETEQARTAFRRQLLQKLQTLPGLKYAGSSTGLPLNDDESVTTAEIKGFGKSIEVIENFGITPGYRKALGTPLLRGRDFNAQDLKPSRSILVNRKLCDIYFHGRDPLGGQIRTGIGDLSKVPWLTIIGVVGDTRHTAIDVPSRPQIFQPVEVGDSFAVSSNLPLQQATALVRSALYSLDPALSIDIKTMHERVALSNARRTFETSLLTGFAAIAILLALVGLYGLMSYTVKQRTPEIGIRLALGSSRSRILRLIVSQGMRLTAFGLLLGLAASFALTRLVNSWLYGVQATDPITFILVPLFVLIVGGAACLIPACAATRIDPIATLRQ